MSEAPPNTWHYGPTETDPDPGKRWHYGCGGEVLYLDGDICDCGQTWDDLDIPVKLCGKHVYWWNGEYEGNCELAEDHDGDHWDGLSWYDDEGKCKDWDHA